MSVLLIKHYDRGADLHAIKQFFHFVLWCIDTAVGTGSLVDVPAEFFAPSGVMNTDTALHRHPEFHRRCIPRSP